MKIDMHVHTKYSPDCRLDPKTIIKTEKSRGVGCVAITDHNVFSKLSEFRNGGIDVIRGEEISTDKGHLIGLFLEEGIKSRDFFDACDEIKRNGGIRILPHPFRSHRGVGVLAREVDMMEIFNARTGEKQNAKALELALAQNVPGICGSDAHFGMELGKCVIDVGSMEPRKAILRGKFVTRCAKSPFFVHPLTWSTKFVNTLSKNR